MNDEKEKSISSVEQEIISMMGNAGNEIADLAQKEIGTRAEEIAQKIHIVDLSRCVIYLAKEMDKLVKSIKGTND